MTKMVQKMDMRASRREQAAMSDEPFLRAVLGRLRGPFRMHAPRGRRADAARPAWPRSQGVKFTRQWGVGTGAGTACVAPGCYITQM